MDFWKLLSNISTVTGLLTFFGIDYLVIVKIFFTKTKYVKLHKLYPHIRSATLALLIAFILSMFLSWKPWSKIHYGDVVPIVKHDTVKLKKPTQPLPHEKKSFNKKIDYIKPTPKEVLNKVKLDTIKPSSKNLNTGANYGNMQVGDNTTMNIKAVEPELNDVIKNALLERLKFFREKEGVTTKKVLVCKMQVSNGDKVITQIATLLTSMGYTCDTSCIQAWSDTNGIAIIHNGNESIGIMVGMLPIGK